MKMNVEEALRAIREKAAVLRYMTNGVGEGEAPDPDVLGGIGTMCEEIETLTRRVKRALNATTLDTALSATPAQR